MGTLDVVHGSAGAIPILLRAGVRFDDVHVPMIEAAQRLGDALIGAATQTEHGYEWPSLTATSTSTPNDATLVRPMLGYAHGAGGIVCALLELHAATGDDRYRDVALTALREARQRSATVADAVEHVERVAGGERVEGLGWCDGAPSIASTLLHASELLASDADAEPGVESELETMLDAIAMRLADARPWTHSFCLYRGLAGCGDVLLAADDQLTRPEWRAAAEALGEQGLVHFHRPRVPWPCGVPGIGESPSLLLGLAGIGHFYLRLYAPLLVPTLLLLPRAIEASTNVDGDVHVDVDLHGDADVDGVDVEGVVSARAALPEVS